MRKIRFDKIGFNVLADTHNMCYALSLKAWQLDNEKEENNMSYTNVIKSCISFFVSLSPSTCG